MVEKEGGATAANSGPARVSSPSTDSALYSSNTPEKQARNGPAPLHLLTACRCAKPRHECECQPRVLVFKKNGSTFVGVLNPPWGFGGNRLREFLGTGLGPDRYAAKLRGELAALAWRELEHRQRRRDARMREAGQ